MKYYDTSMVLYCGLSDPEFDSNTDEK